MQFLFINQVKTGFATLALASLVACGGGGSSSGTPISSSSAAQSSSMASSSTSSSDGASSSEPASSASSVVSSSSQSSVATGVTLQQLQADIFTPRCSGCHTGSGAPQGLRLDTEQNSFDFLVNQASGEMPSLMRVEPGDPDNSYLVMKIEGAPTITGGRMPLGGAALSSELINQVRDWISNGAPRDGTGAMSTKVRVAEISKADSTIHLIVRFSRSIDTATRLEDIVQLYFINANNRWPAPSDAYQLILLNSQDIGVALERVDQSANALELLVNDPNITAIMDEQGRVIDGDGDELDGGIFRYEFSL